MPEPTGTLDYITNILIPSISLDMEVEQQPEGNNGYVSSDIDKLTQYTGMLKRNAYVVLAHNTVSGQDFDELKPGDLIYANYGDTRQTYKVSEIQQYQALTPNSITSDMKDLKTGETFNVTQAASKAYQADKLTLQTCIEKDGDVNWGRLFVIAEPVESAPAPRTLEHGTADVIQSRKERITPAPTPRIHVPGAGR